MIRLAGEHDLPVLRDIERSAGQVFATIGMTAIAEDEPPTLEHLRGYQRDGRAWVAVDTGDRPVAYLIADVVDGNGHIEQVSVHAEHAGRRLGRALIERAARWSAGRGCPALTLTTFVDVPWNGPYYARLGFRYLIEDELTPDLRRIRAREAKLGLDRWARAAMRRDLATLDR